MSFTVSQIVAAFVAPGLMVAFAAILGLLLFRDPRLLLAPAIAVGFCTACKWIEPRIGWPPTANATYLLFYIPIIGGCLTFFDSVFWPAMWMRGVALLLFWHIAVWLLLANLIPGTLSVATVEIAADVSTFVTLAWWRAFDQLAESAPGVAAPLLMAITSVAAAIFLALGWLIQTAGALAFSVFCICIAGAAVGFFSSRLSFSRGFAQMIVMLLQLLLVYGYFFTDATLGREQKILLALLLLSPALPFLGDIGWIQKRRPWLRVALRLLPVIILLGVISGITVHDFFQTQENSAAAGEE